MHTKINNPEEKQKTALSGIIDFPRLKIIEKRITTKPTHDVKITPEFGTKLMDICDNSHTNISGGEIPADILFAKTIPMTDFNIEIIDEKPNKRIVHPSVRVIMLDNYESSVDNIVPEDVDIFTGLGIIMFNYGKPLPMSVYKVFGVFPDSDQIFFMDQLCIAGCGTALEYSRKKHKFCTTLFSETEMNPVIRTILKMWYGVQISLLNPVISAGFHRETKLVEKKYAPTNSKKKPPLRYKKVIYLNEAFIDKDEEIKRIFTRKTQCWYVTGHWRNQAVKNGHKRIFIQGYWKGIAAKTKQTEPREREIVFGNETDEFLRMVKMHIEKEKKQDE